MTAFIHWSQGPGGAWCTLSEVELEHESFDGVEGVYVIWHGKQDQVTLRVGQGSIRERLAEERKNARLLAYGLDKLMVTWARVNALHREAVASYLADVLNPKLGESYSGEEQIQVNVPWRSHPPQAPSFP
jgi:hypothetical protein